MNDNLSLLPCAAAPNVEGKGALVIHLPASEGVSTLQPPGLRLRSTVFDLKLVPPSLKKVALHVCKALRQLGGVGAGLQAQSSVNRQVGQVRRLGQRRATDQLLEAAHCQPTRSKVRR